MGSKISVGLIRDLLALHEAFEQINGVSLEFDGAREPQVILEGRFEGHAVAVMI